MMTERLRGETMHTYTHTHKPVHARAGSYTNCESYNGFLVEKKDEIPQNCMCKNNIYLYSI